MTPLKMECKRQTVGTDQIGAPCPRCGHANMVHPGMSDKKGLLTECVVCALARLVKESGG